MVERLPSLPKLVKGGGISFARVLIFANMKVGGLRGLFRGWSVSVARLVPTFVVGSTIYEQSRRALGLAYL